MNPSMRRGSKCSSASSSLPVPPSPMFAGQDPSSRPSSALSTHEGAAAIPPSRQSSTKPIHDTPDTLSHRQRSCGVSSSEPAPTFHPPNHRRTSALSTYSETRRSSALSTHSESPPPPPIRPPTDVKAEQHEDGLAGLDNSKAREAYWRGPRSELLQEAEEELRAASELQNRWSQSQTGSHHSASKRVQQANSVRGPSVQQFGVQLPTGAEAFGARMQLPAQSAGPGLGESLLFELQSVRVRLTQLSSAIDDDAKRLHVRRQPGTRSRAASSIEARPQNASRQLRFPGQYPHANASLKGAQRRPDAHASTSQILKSTQCLMPEGSASSSVQALSEMEAARLHASAALAASSQALRHQARLRAL